MSGRDAIFKKIRAGLGVKGDEADRLAAVNSRIAARERHPTPERVAGKNAVELKALFRRYLEGQSATVLDVSAAEVPAAVAGYLRDTNLPQRVRCGSDPYLDKLPWDRAPSLDRERGPAHADDEVSLSHAVSGVAETGTLVLASGPDNPVTLNFLPETHIIVVEEKDLVGPYEDALALIRSKFGDRMMPRTVNLISGPSRTGDIGGKIVMGAHGPRRLCVIIVRP